MKRDNLKKNFIWNIIGSIFNASTSLFFLILVTRINGVDSAGIFSFAFSTACLLQVIGLYAGRTYQVTEQNQEITDYDYIYNRLFSCLIMIIIGFIFSFVKGYDNYKIVIIICLVIYKSVEAFSEVIYGIIQKNNDLYKVGISLFIKGVIGLILFAIINLITNNIVLSAISLIIVNFVLLLLYDLKNIKIYNLYKGKINFRHIIYIFKFGIWTFLFTFLTQYVINAPKYAIDKFLTNDYQTIYGIIAMPATLMILCSQFLIHPFLVSLTNHLKDKNIREFNNLIFKLILFLIIFGVVVDMCAYFLGIPFLEFIYNVNLGKYLKCLLYIITGAIIFGMSYILCNALTTMRKTFIQVIVFAISSAFAYLSSDYLVKINSIEGAAIAYLLTMIILFILYLIVYIFEIKKYKKRCNNV